MWFAVMLMFVGGKTEYTPFGKPYETYEQCVDSIDPTLKKSAYVTIECYDKDILITLLKNQ